MIRLMEGAKVSNSAAANANQAIQHRARAGSIKWFFDGRALCMSESVFAFTRNRLDLSQRDVATRKQ